VFIEAPGHSIELGLDIGRDLETDLA